jgi:hypothetical protein
MGKASKRKSDRRTGTGPSRTEIESKVRQEQVRRRLTAALNQPGQLGDTLRQVAGEAAAAQASTGDAVTGLWGGVTPVPAEVPQWEAGHFGRPVSDAEADEIVTGPALVTGSALVEAARAVIAEDRIAPVMEFLEPVLDAAVAPLGLSAELTGAAVARALACAVAHAYTLWVPIALSGPLTRCPVLDEGLPGWASGCVRISQSGTLGIRVTAIRLPGRAALARLACPARPLRPGQGRRDPAPAPAGRTCSWTLKAKRAA